LNTLKSVGIRKSLNSMKYSFSNPSTPWLFFRFKFFFIAVMISAYVISLSNSSNTQSPPVSDYTDITFINRNVKFEIGYFSFDYE
jgi:hypothetical protein